MTDTHKILYHTKDAVAEITLNNPAKLNCMGFEMLRALDEAVQSAGNDQDVRVVLVKGAGERAFSTGADLNEYRSLSPEKAIEWIEYGSTLFNKIERLPKPTVALINGYAMGGGLELALSCDFRLGTETAVVSSPELQHGWLPGWGGITRLHRLIGEARAKEVVMLNERIPAIQALNFGILTRILSSEEENEELDAFLKHLSGIKPEVYAEAKEALIDSSG